METRKVDEAEHVLARLDDVLNDLPPLRTRRDVYAAFDHLLEKGMDDIPFPAEGRTFLRWQILSRVTAFNLSLGKLLEGHTDALAVFHELRRELPEGQSWGIWAAEPPYARLRILSADRSGKVRLDGTKAWCSGAAIVRNALMTAWNEKGEQQLVAVSMKQPGINVTERGWQAIGMADTGSVEVDFHNAEGLMIGEGSVYLSRPGFWHGGAGVAACWYGGCCRLAETLRQACRKRAEPHALAHLGAVDSLTFAARKTLHAIASWIDAHPSENAELMARRARSICEETVTGTIAHVGRALGASIYCQHAELARLLADLPVFVRQSHAERDLEAQARKILDLPDGCWQL